MALGLQSTPARQEPQKIGANSFGLTLLTSVSVSRILPPMENLAYLEWDQPEYRRLVSRMIMPADALRIQEMRDAFGTILLNRPIFPFNMARTGLATALRTFNGRGRTPMK
jgi:hypothetical protein